MFGGNGSQRGEGTELVERLNNVYGHSKTPRTRHLSFPHPVYSRDPERKRSHADVTRESLYSETGATQTAVGPPYTSTHTVNGPGVASVLDTRHSRRDKGLGRGPSKVSPLDVDTHLRGLRVSQ